MSVVVGSSCASCSGSIPSSMETVPTDMVEGYGSDEDASNQAVWGRLFPIGASFSAIGDRAALFSLRFEFDSGDSALRPRVNRFSAITTKKCLFR